MKKLILLLTILLSASAFTQESIPSLDLAKKVYSIIDEKGQQYKFNEKENETFMTLHWQVHAELIAEFEQEAEDNGMNRDEYANSDLSMDAFVVKLESQVANMQDLEDVEVFLLLIQSGLRFRIHSSGRLLANNYTKNADRAQKSILKLAKRLGMSL